MKPATINTVLLRESAASFIWSHSWLKPGEAPTRYLPGSVELARVMRFADKDGYRRVCDGDLDRFPNTSCIKAALSSAGFVEGTDYKDGEPTQVLYMGF